MTRPGLPKLVATDLDGTLVRSDDTVSAYSHEVLGRVRAAGIPIVGVTGRGPRIIGLCRQDIPEADYLVLAQGARVVDLTEPAGPVTLRGVTKASGLAVIADSLGVDPRDVLVFGDMPNDLPMFGWAGWSRVAVAGAHPEVLAMADEVTASNDEDGVAAYLDRLLSER